MARPRQQFLNRAQLDAILLKEDGRQIGDIAQAVGHSREAVRKWFINPDSLVFQCYQVWTETNHAHLYPQQLNPPPMTRKEVEDRRLAHQQVVNWRRKLKEIERMLGPIDWDGGGDGAAKMFSQYADLIEAAFDPSAQQDSRHSRPFRLLS